MNKITVQNIVHSTAFEPNPDLRHFMVVIFIKYGSCQKTSTQQISTITLIVSSILLYCLFKRCQMVDRSFTYYMSHSWQILKLCQMVGRSLKWVHWLAGPYTMSDGWQVLKLCQILNMSDGWQVLKMSPLVGRSLYYVRWV